MNDVPYSFHCSKCKISHAGECPTPTKDPFQAHLEDEIDKLVREAFKTREIRSKYKPGHQH